MCAERDREEIINFSFPIPFRAYHGHWTQINLNCVLWKYRHVPIKDIGEEEDEIPKLQSFNSRYLCYTFHKLIKYALSIAFQWINIGTRTNFVYLTYTRLKFTFVLSSKWRDMPYFVLNSKCLKWWLLRFSLVNLIFDWISLNFDIVNGDQIHFPKASLQQEINVKGEYCWYNNKVLIIFGEIHNVWE